MRPPNATSALSLECPVGIPQRDKPRKVFVGFTVNDETGPLLTHVHEIAPVVEAIIWIEGTTSFSGLPRPSTLARLRTKLAPYMPKIFEQKVSGGGQRLQQEATRKKDRFLASGGWRSAEHLYNMAGKVLLDDQNFRRRFLARPPEPDDVLIVLDADEVIRREALMQVKHCKFRFPMRFQMRNFVYDFQHYNYQVTRGYTSYFQEADWSFATGITVHQLTVDGIQPHAARVARIADKVTSNVSEPLGYQRYRRLPETVFPNAGWHMHLFFGPKQIARKRAMGFHHSYNRRPLNHTPSLHAMMVHGRHPLQLDCMEVGRRITPMVSCKVRPCDEPEMARGAGRVACVFPAREPREALPHIVRDDPSMECLVDRIGAGLDRVCPSDVEDIDWP